MNENFGNELTEETLIGVVYDTGYLTEDTIGTVYSKGVKGSRLFEIHVFPNDGGHIPHCHFINKTTGVDGCVKLENAEYFPHGKHVSLMSSRDANGLNAFMQSRVNKRSNMTNWEKCVKKWDEASNRARKTLRIIHQPTYSVLQNNTTYTYYDVRATNYDNVFVYITENRGTTKLASIKDDIVKIFGVIDPDETGKVKGVDILDYITPNSRTRDTLYFKKEGLDILRDMANNLGISFNAFNIRGIRFKAAKIKTSNPYIIIANSNDREK